jgi:adenosylmethionine-8-amino-7-oxononanoate aminotransferase
VMIGDAVTDVFEADATGAAAIGHGYTYSGHPVGAAAALACLAETSRLNVVENAAARGAELFAGLQALQARHTVIGDVRGGHGLMLAVELVADPATKKAADKAVPGRVQAAAYKAGAMVRVSGANIIMSPPLVVTSADVQVILTALEEGFAVL